MLLDISIFGIILPLFCERATIYFGVLPYRHAPIQAKLLIRSSDESCQAVCELTCLKKSRVLKRSKRACSGYTLSLNRNLLAANVLFHSFV